jgi:hypothetical protein
MGESQSPTRRMTSLHAEPKPGTTSPDFPELPPGWSYTEDVAWDDGYAGHRVRRLVIGVAFAVAVAAALAGLMIWNASAHYSRGVDALKNGSYAAAIIELSAAKVIVLPYRDSKDLADQAHTRLAAEIGVRQQQAAREAAVSSALEQAGTAFDAGNANAVVAALMPLSASDLQAALKGSDQLRVAARRLEDRLTVAARNALGRSEWGRAQRYASAVLVLDPLAQTATALGAKARTGEALTAKLAKARDAAGHGRWRSALRLALAVTAARKDFPGAAALAAQARKALAPKPSPTAAAIATTATTPPTTTGGTSSGSPPQPPPP